MTRYLVRLKSGDRRPFLHHCMRNDLELLDGPFFSKREAEERLLKEIAVMEVMES